MKAIRIQIDMIYQVEDDLAQEIYEREISVFNAIKDNFGTWGDNPNDPRDPVDFDLRHSMGDVVDDSNGEE